MKGAKLQFMLNNSFNSISVCARQEIKRKKKIQFKLKYELFRFVKLSYGQTLTTKCQI